MKPLNVQTLPLDKKVLIEASAGTGKTYTIGLIVIRLLLEKLVPIEKIVLITFTEAASFELKKNTSEKIREAHNIWKNGSENKNALYEIIENAKTENMQIKEANLLDAIARIDEMTVFTIHAFCRKLLNEFAFETGNFEDKEVVTDTDDIIDRVIADFWRENVKNREMLIDLTPGHLKNAAYNVLKHPKAEITGEKADDPELKDRALQYAVVHKFAKEVRQRLQQEKQKLKIIDFNDMIEDCRKAVENDSKNNFVLKNAVNKRFDAIIVDEFQDTDQLQYEIFDYLFQNKPFFMIGDPKQAIYRFRGGDIAAYLKARESAGGNQYSMNTNYRSEKTLLDAMNGFFTNSAFHGKMGRGIEYHGVACGKPELMPVKNEKGSYYKPFVIWKGNNKENKDVFMSKVQEAVLSEIKRLLSTENVQPQDITILLNTNEDCLYYKNALSREGIYSIFSGGTIFSSNAAEFLRLLLNAVCFSNRTGFVRAFLTHEYIGYEPEDIDDSVFIKWTDVLVNAKSQWVKHGIMHCIDFVLSGQNLWSNIAESPDGKRSVRNIRQILDILSKEENAQGNIPEKIIKCYNTYCDEQTQSEETKERLETDEKALKIMTLHSAKGLQFDIVFIPDVTRRPASHKFPHAYMYYKNEKKYIAFIDNSNEGEKQLNDEAENQESARLLYVAITRAKYRVYIAYNPCYSRSSSYLREIFDEFCINNSGIADIQIENLDNIHKEKIKYNLMKKSNEIKKTSKPFNLKIDPSWNRTSFSGISLKLKHPEFIYASARTAEEPPAGKRMGTLLHSIFENLNFNAKETEICNMVENKLSGYKEFSGEEGEAKKTWIKEKIRIILNKNLGTAGSLCRIDEANRVTELDFFMNSKDINLIKIKEVLKKKINDFEDNELTARYIKGAIDLVFTGTDGKFYILDWKSNSLNDYSREGIEEKAMMPHGYHLQYYIYAVALKRWLEITHNQFDFKKQFGGVHYIFIRGVTEENNDNGIYFVDSKDIAESIEELDKCFGRRA